MSWRTDCAPIIQQVLKDTKGKSEKEIRKAIKEAYPYGQRSMHPYKIWCSEVRNQRFGKKRTKRLQNLIEPPEQLKLF